MKMILKIKMIMMKCWFQEVDSPDGNDDDHDDNDDDDDDDETWFQAP